ncbi:MAG: BrnT family toxin [Woronichinia naegeliana WA131]|uniref:BrnT family toxin n=1 Tax=Woronichinia naegeliana WA131 TaxID=2824559 RepID=A0A977L560_9CYAN|nr:MAG: BrnT family toxin [Woronichinia naegeliana WA131]
MNDPLHSQREARLIDLGMSINNRLLTVTYTERQDVIRIISCRKATLTERKLYEQS